MTLLYKKVKSLPNFLWNKIYLTADHFDTATNLNMDVFTLLIDAIDG